MDRLRGGEHGVNLGGLWLIPSTSDHREQRIFAESGVGFGEAAPIEDAAGCGGDCGCMTTGFAEADLVHRMLWSSHRMWIHLGALRFRPAALCMSPIDFSERVHHVPSGLAVALFAFWMSRLACSTPRAGSCLGFKRPTCTSNDAWSQ